MRAAGVGEVDIALWGRGFFNVTLKNCTIKGNPHFCERMEGFAVAVGC